MRNLFLATLGRDDGRARAKRAVSRILASFALGAFLVGCATSAPSSAGGVVLRRPVSRQREGD
jgi:hypothetical protein